MWLPSFFVLVILAIVYQCHAEKSEWKWVCQNNKCEKQRNSPESTGPVLTLEACMMFCQEHGLLWPMPTGGADLGNFLSKININKIKVYKGQAGKSEDMVDAAVERFKDIIKVSIPPGMESKASGKSVDIYLHNVNPDERDFSLKMDESYEIKVSYVDNDRVVANVTGNTFFGVRHGLETLSQLFIYDDNWQHLLMVRDASISDKPVYPYRGILLDTSRNYYSINAIKRMIDGMAAVKLNTFHWHITDSHSFPFVSQRRPQLSKLGAYSPSKVYTRRMIEDLVQYARVRGVRVLPEFDAPAHVGEGWQDTNLTVCFNASPWPKYCVEPPCGQLNPVREELYDVLEDIYRDMADVFQPDMFHMGGDEVSEGCWNSSTEIQEFMAQNRWDLKKSSFMKLWNHFQTKAQDRAYKAFGSRLPLVLWTSTLTELGHIEDFLSKDDYIIQVWTTGVDPQIAGLLQRGYQLIISNYDALYMDCGFGAWIGSGNNWCSPYIGWHKVYENSPSGIALQYKDQILGGEAALWSEQSDSSSLDGRLWPRAAAMAERMWAEPTAGWQAAEFRMLHMRERLVRMGIQADSLQPEWCLQNEGSCST